MQRYIFIIIISLCIPLVVKSQFCTGNLGDNIFQEGNFGSGIPNLLSPNPGIAPGYNYTFSVPPVDGQYVITNNTAVWSGLYASWLTIGDNSPDPNGYMMVVNASNAPGLFYEQTVTGLCENTLYEFSADIINLIRAGVPDHLDPNVSFLLNGIQLFSTGNIPKTDSWNTYGFTFSTEVAQESLTLSLRNNAPGGIGNDLAIDNISFRACGPETLVEPGASEINLCEGDQPITLQGSLMGNQYVSPAIQWQQSLDEGLTWTDIIGENGPFFTTPSLAVGTFYYRFLVADGASNLASEKCRVNSNPKIINVGANESVQINTTICEGQTVTVGSSVYSEAGIYQDTFVNFVGCDSILITNLMITPDSIFRFESIITPPCPDQTDGSISIENITGGAAPFNFTFEGTDFGMTNFFQDLPGGATYTLLLEDNNGCSIETTTFLPETASFMADLTVTPPCPNQTNGSITIENVSGGTAPYNYTFEGVDAGTNTIFPDLSGGTTYTVLVEDDNGCSFERSAEVEQPIDFRIDLTVNPPCPNQTNGIISIDSVKGGTPPYNFIFEGLEVGTTTLFSDLPGDSIYTIGIEDANGCIFEETTFIEQPSVLVFELGADQVVELGESVKVSPFYNFTPTDFTWQTLAPFDTTICEVFEDCDELDFVPLSSQQIILELFSSPGCSLTDSLLIEVLEVRQVYLPNVFSPNGDGTNDFFTVFANTANVQIVEDLKIFNRWGALIFEQNNFLPNLGPSGWNGTFNGELAPLGVYVYTATVRFIDGEVLRYSGDVSVVK